jgi:adenylate cyclase
MALFGAPFRQEDHALRALNAALAMQKAHAAWMEQRGRQGAPARPLGIGVASGHVVLGAYGTSNRMEYTALGPAVNLASRLCDAAEAGEILTVPYSAGQAAARAGGFAAFTSKGSMQLKNIPEPVEVLSLKRTT